MHEFSIAEALVKAVAEELAKLEPPPGRLKRVRVVIGDMRQVVPDTLAFAYETLVKDTPATGSVLEIQPQPITARCRDCSWAGKIEGHVFCCKECDSANVEILTGKELYLSNLEFDENE